MKKTMPEFLFKLAKDFVSLSYKEKLAIGKDMELIGGMEYELSEEDLEDIIFVGMFKKNLTIPFAQRIHEIANDEY